MQALNGRCRIRTWDSCLNIWSCTFVDTSTITCPPWVMILFCPRPPISRPSSCLSTGKVSISKHQLPPPPRAPPSPPTPLHHTPPPPPPPYLHPPAVWVFIPQYMGLWGPMPPLSFCIPNQTFIYIKKYINGDCY